MKCESFLILHRQQGYTIKAQKRSKDKLQEYFLCIKKPKIIVFNDFFSPGTVLSHYREYNDTYRVHSSACKQCAAHAFSTSAASHACVVLSWTRVKDWEGEVVLLKLLFLFSLREKNPYSRSFIKLRLNHWNVTWTILTMSLQPFCALNMSVALLSIQSQKALGFHQKYLNLCSEDEWRSDGFGWQNFHFWVNYPSKYRNH